jgi:transcription initiation factor TFIIIB Brf1 subunit/transcription initiation factor TFIIB
MNLVADLGSGRFSELLIQENRTKKEIASVAGITYLTPRKRFNELKSTLQLRA